MLITKDTYALVNFFNKNTDPVGALVTLKTEVKLKKTGNPFGKIFKIQVIKANLNENYAEVVNNVREFEGKAADFVAQERSWGKKINGAFIEKEDGSLYLSAIEVEKVGDVSYVDSDGKSVDKKDFEQFMPAVSGNKSQGTDIKVNYRTYKMSSVIGLTIVGQIKFDA